jgi:hypothetical protein
VKVTAALTVAAPEIAVTTRVPARTEATFAVATPFASVTPSAVESRPGAESVTGAFGTGFPSTSRSVMEIATCEPSDGATGGFVASEDVAVEGGPEAGAVPVPGGTVPGGAFPDDGAPGGDVPDDVPGAGDVTGVAGCWPALGGAAAGAPEGPPQARRPTRPSGPTTRTAAYTQRENMATLRVSMWPIASAPCRQPASTGREPADGGARWSITPSVSGSPGAARRGGHGAPTRSRQG